MKRLFICNTYMQLIMAVHMKLTLFKNDETDLWLSDCSNGATEVAKRLQNTHLFRDVKLKIWNNKFYTQSPIYDIWDVFSYSFTTLNIKTIDFYDEILFYNPILDIFAISDYYRQKKHHVKWSCFDEGIFSYNTNLIGGKRYKLCRLIRNMTMRYDPFLHISAFYCMFPQLKTTHLDWELILVPSIEEDKDKLINVLNAVFDFYPLNLPQYIYFASSSDIDGNPYGETEFVLKLANLLGKNNFIVKTHPRDKRSIFQDYSIKTLQESYIPWEVIQLNMNTTSNVLLTLTSGSFISITAMMNEQGKNIKGYFLYNTHNWNSHYYTNRCKEIKSQLDKLHKSGLCLNLRDNISIIDNLK